MFAQFIFNGKRKAATQENLPELMSKPCSIQTTTRNCSSSNNEIKPSTKELVAMEPDKIGTLNRISGYLQAPGRASTVAEFNDYLKKLRQIDEPSGLGVFLVLIASLLSIQTKDRVAMAAMETLRDNVGDAALCPAVLHRRIKPITNAIGVCKRKLQPITQEKYEDLGAAQEIAKHISSTNFYKTKAQNIICIASLLVQKYDGLVPRTLSQLKALPGIGEKVALLVLTVGHAEESAGIVVDTHVHRVSQRLGWVHTDKPNTTIKRPKPNRPQTRKAEPARITPAQVYF
jgi:endonuclease III